MGKQKKNTKNPKTAPCSAYKIVVIIDLILNTLDKHNIPGFQISLFSDDSVMCKQTNMTLMPYLPLPTS